jgi:VWFA-related protein
MTTRGRLIGSLAAVCCALVVQAPMAGAEKAPEQVRLVRLHVAAFDGNGKPVDGLTADDFKVRDQNKDRRIVLFHRDVATPPAAGEYSNRVARSTRAATAILLDMLNQNRQAQLDSIKDLTKTLGELKSGASLFLYVLTVDGALQPLHPVEDWSKVDWNQQAEKLLEKAKGDAGLPRPAGMTKEDRTKKTYVALEALSSKLAMFPGHREIVWLNYDIPSVFPSTAASSASRPSVDYQTPMGGDSKLSQGRDSVGWIANQDSQCESNVWMDCALYMAHMVVTLDRDDTSVYLVNYSGALSPDAARGNELFAGMMGGRSYLSQGLDTVLAQSAADAEGGYTLAYEEPNENWDSKYHESKLTCTRKGIEILARQRYYALPDKRDAAAREQGALAVTFNIPSDVDTIGLRASVAPGEKPGTVRLQIRVDPADLLLSRHGNAYDGQIAVAWVNYNAAGPAGAPGFSRPAVHLTSDQYREGMNAGIPIVQDVAVDSTIKVIRLFVVDRTTDLAGSLTIPLGNR